MVGVGARRPLPPPLRGVQQLEQALPPLHKDGLRQVNNHHSRTPSTISVRLYFLKCVQIWVLKKMKIWTHLRKSGRTEIVGGFLPCCLKHTHSLQHGNDLSWKMKHSIAGVRVFRGNLKASKLIVV